MWYAALRRRRLATPWTVAALRGAASGEGARDLKHQLRELYKRVHPDKFQAFPQAHAANERSFKLLQEYLDTALQSRWNRDIAGSPYHFEFYLYGSTSTAEAKDDNVSAIDAGDLKRVALTLPPPSRADAGAAAAGDLPHGTRKALGQLLVACGLEGAIKGDGAVASRALLHEFLPGAAELARQRALELQGPRSELSTLRTALRLGRGVTLSFAPVAPTDASSRVELVRGLAKALDLSVGLQLRGLHISLGNGYAIGQTGEVILDVRDTPLQWTGFLHQVDLEKCRTRITAVERLKGLEAAVAAVLGVAMIYAPPALTMDPRYSALLQSLAAQGLPPVGNGELRNVPVRALDPGPAGSSPPALKSGEDQVWARGWEVDLQMGFLSVPVDANAADVRAFIEAHGQRVSSALRVLRENATHDADLQRAVELRLRLRRLSRTAGLSSNQFRAACTRLLAQSGALVAIMEGLEIRIAEVNQVAPSGNHIDIAWDFKI